MLSLSSGGGLLAYILSRLIVKEEMASRTISIEVGMQNSGLGIVLASQNFSDPATAIPCAIASVFYSLIGSLLAAYWRMDVNKKSRTHFENS